VLSGRGICGELIPGSEEYYRVYVFNCVWSGATVTVYSYSEWVERGQKRKERKNVSEDAQGMNRM
jgi:hypothetical protein